MRDYLGRLRSIAWGLTGRLVGLLDHDRKSDANALTNDVGAFQLTAFRHRINAGHGSWIDSYGEGFHAMCAKITSEHKRTQAVFSQTSLVKPKNTACNAGRNALHCTALFA